MFQELERINARPKPFAHYTAADLWTDGHTSRQMLTYHLDEDLDVSSRNHAFIDRSVDWIVSHFKVGTDTRIADFGCGPGLYTTRLARTGAAVTGIDFSENSLRYAQAAADKAGLNVRYIHRNYLEFDAEARFDLVMMIMCDFCALGPDQRRRLLEIFSRSLAPGGAVLLDVYTLKAYDHRHETAAYEENMLDGFWSPDRYFAFLNTFKYDAEKVVLDKITVVEAGRTRTVYNWLQYFTPDALAKELAAAGFTVEGLLADVAGTPFDSTAEEMAIVARKPL